MERETRNHFEPRQRGLPVSTFLLLRVLPPCFLSRSGRHRTTLNLMLVLVAILPLALTSLVSARPRTLENFLSEGKQLEEKQDYDGAIKTYLQASSAFPDQPEIFKRLGIMYQTELKFANSIQAFQKALQLD